MSDTASELQAEIANMRHYRRQTGYDEDCDPRQLTPTQCKCVLISANLAPKLADALEAAEARVESYAAEVMRLRNALRPFAAAYGREVAAATLVPPVSDRASVWVDDLAKAAAALEGRDDE